VQLNLPDAPAVRRAYRAIQTSVREKAGPEHFQGVTVQPMVKLDGYEIIIGSSLDPQFGPVLLFGAHERLTRICFIDYDREMALVAEYQDPDTGEQEIVGVGRLSRRRGASEAEFAVLVSDTFHRRGLGTELLKRLLQVGRDEKLDRITAEILPENHPMQQICEELGFRMKFSGEDRTVKAEIDLSSR